MGGAENLGEVGDEEEGLTTPSFEPPATDWMEAMGGGRDTGAFGPAEYVDVHASIIDEMC